MKPEQARFQGKNKYKVENKDSEIDNFKGRYHSKRQGDSNYRDPNGE